MKHVITSIAFVIICIAGYSQKTGTVTDPRDGKVYTTVQIGDQWIMSQNLAYRPERGLFWDDTIHYDRDIKAPYILAREKSSYKFKDGKGYFVFGYLTGDKNKIKSATSSDKSLVVVGSMIFDSTKFFGHNLFDGYMVFDKNLFDRFGYLYDFETAKASAIPGWHVPTGDEWKQLLKSLGGNAKSQFTSLMEGGSSGFNAVLCGWGTVSPGGSRSRGISESQGSYWSSSKTGHMATCLDLNGPPELKPGAARMGLVNTGTGLSVRLIMDKGKSQK